MSWTQLTTQPISDADKLSGLELILNSFSSELRADNAAERDEQIDSCRQKLITEIALRYPPRLHLWLEAITNVIADLYNQKWQLKVQESHILGKRPNSISSREDLKERFVSRRNQQLRQDSVQRFIKGMEKWRLFNGEQVSILSLMTDGRKLSEKLLTSKEQAIKPYIQFVNTGQKCEHTGLKLQDIWRYFRHTWANPYESIPGRSILMIVRDAATQFHSVIGISALSSAAVRLGARDKFIGWDTDDVIKEFTSQPTEEMAEWPLKILEKSLNHIYIIDFIKEGALSSDENSNLNQETIDTLRAIALQQKETHHRLMQAGEYRAEKEVDKNTDNDWEDQALTPLFKSKRASELANLLEIRLEIDDAYTNQTGKNRLITLLSTETGRKTFSKIIRIARSMTVGTEIADLTLCGAVAPYNHLAAGKLVAMLSASPETISAYKKRYQHSSSIIASSMAGRIITRPANLVFIGTTSLYGKRPNQYDRISYPSSLIGGKQNIKVQYKFIPDIQTNKVTKGVGTFHFTSNTLSSMEKFSSSINGGWKVNNVFGEGTSPKLRALRQGLESLGVNAEKLLVHGIGKCLYGVNLTSNTSHYLLGLESDPAYNFILEHPKEATSKLGQWWYTRWATKRIQRADVIEKLNQETLIYPIRHHAKVSMPQSEDRQIDLL